MKPRTEDPSDGPPCPGCRGPTISAPAPTSAGAAVLRERGRLMTAVEVERRAGGAK